MSHTQIDYNDAFQNNSSLNNWLFFLGGLIINLFWLPNFSTHNITNPALVQEILEFVFSREFGIHIIKSATAGTITLLFKLLIDHIKHSKNNKGGKPNG